MLAKQAHSRSCQARTCACLALIAARASRRQCGSVRSISLNRRPPIPCANAERSSGIGSVTTGSPRPAARSINAGCGPTTVRR
jgi:hypothetical protein